MVEILADGASALYGADAIAGVVNFITKKCSTDGGLEINVSTPARAGGQELLTSISKGFGDIERDGYNLLAGLSMEKVGSILANRRSFSKPGVIPFEHQGRKLHHWQVSLNANPPNVDLFDTHDNLLDRDASTLVSSGSCGADPAAVRQGVTARRRTGRLGPDMPVETRPSPAPGSTRWRASVPRRAPGPDPG